MMRVINDPKADPARRDRLAIALLPYFHGAQALPIGKKQQAEARAEIAGHGANVFTIQPPPRKAN
jgi:hypothetical protein